MTVDTATGEVLEQIHEGEIVPEGFNPKSWDDHVEYGRQKVQQIKENQLAVGYLAHSVAERWGSKSLQKFASSIGCALSTVYEYRRVYRAFPDGGPAELDYSHLRTATKAGTANGEHIEAANMAAIEGLTTRSLERRIQEKVELDDGEKQGWGKAEDSTGKTRVCPACGGAGEVPA